MSGMRDLAGPATAARSSTGPASTCRPVIASTSVWTRVPHAGNSRATIVASPSVTPACETSPIQTSPAVGCGSPPPARPMPLPAQIADDADQRRSRARAVRVAPARGGRSDAPAAAKKTISTGSDPRSTACLQHVAARRRDVLDDEPGGQRGEHRIQVGHRRELAQQHAQRQQHERHLSRRRTAGRARSRRRRSRRTPATPAISQAECHRRPDIVFAAAARRPRGRTALRA